jgi:hypothetical protein
LIKRAAMASPMRPRPIQPIGCDALLLDALLFDGLLLDCLLIMGRGNLNDCSAFLLALQFGWAFQRCPCP